MFPQYVALAGRMFNAPLMYAPEKSIAVARELGPRILGAPVAFSSEMLPFHHMPKAGIVDDEIGRVYDSVGQLPFPVINGVAVIEVSGTLVHKGTFTGAQSGVTSYEGLQAQITRAQASPTVKGVVFDIDCFGGEVSGAFETAQMIASLSASKPTIAILTDFALSAAYLLASQTRQIILPEFGQAGSIGVIIMHADYSQMMRGSGVGITIISSGAHKADGNPYEPLAPDVQQKLQATIDTMRDKFATVVGAGRGKRLSKAQALATEANTYMGQDAVSNGLADAISSPTEAFAAFVAAVN